MDSNPCGHCSNINSSGNSEEYIRCNLCGADDYKIIYKKIDNTEKVSLLDKFSAAKGFLCTDQIVRCNECGLVYINPRTKSDIIIDSTSKGDDEKYVSQEKGRMETFEKELKWLNKYTKKGRLLDVGCAAGFFLNVAKKAKWDAQGVEPNKWLANHGKENYGLKVFAGTLEDAEFKDEEFEVITLWDVIEHMPDPNGSLKEINRIMKPGGTLVVSTPDYSSIFAKIFGRKWWFLLSHHLFYFTPRTMKMMLEQNGFKVKVKKLHWQKLNLQYMIDMVKHLSKSKLVHKGHKTLSSVFKLFKLHKLEIPYYASQIDIIAVKK